MAGYCDQCDRHCPLDALRCGRGYRKYGEVQPEEHERVPENRTEWEHHGDHERHDAAKRHGRHEHHSEHERRNEHHGDECHRGEHHHDEHHRGEHHHDECHHGEHHHDECHHGEHRHDEHHRGEYRDERCHDERHRDERCHEDHRHDGHGPSAEELRDRLETGDLSELMHMCGHVLHRRPEAHAARGQGKILSILADEGAVSQKLLQQALHIQPGSMSEIVTKLENKGLLTRTRGEDRRGNVLTITEEGRRIAQQEDVSGEDLFSALTKDQQYQLRSLLQALLTDWLQRFDPRFSNRA